MSDADLHQKIDIRRPSILNHASALFEFSHLQKNAVHRTESIDVFLAFLFSFITFLFCICNRGDEIFLSVTRIC